MNTEKKRSERNKTLDISVEEGAQFFSKCISVKEQISVEKIVDKTICGDTLSVMKLLPHAFVDLAIVDPPYNLSKNYAGSTFNKTSDESYSEYTKEWLNLLLPLLKSNASFYICCDWKSSIVISQVLSEYEKDNRLIIQNRITWQREKGRGASANWKNAMEDIWFCTVSGDYVFNLDDVKVRRKVIAPYKVDGKPKDWKEEKNGSFRDTCPGNFWDDISIPFWSMSENTAHPTQKPEKLLAKLILASSSKDSVVFDPFLGSGTTSVTAKKLLRHYVGVEKSEQYCTWAEKRLADAENDKAIQGYEGGVFWERNTKATVGKNN
ncbi:MAG: site-specific DNA-methyltransferase [Treponema sp.]